MRITHDSKKNYSEIYTLSSLRGGLWEVNEPIAARLRDGEKKPRSYWWTLAWIAEARVLTKSWKKLAKYISTSSEEEFDRFFELAEPRRSKFLVFLKMTEKSEASGKDLLIFYKNLAVYQPRVVREGIKNLDQSYKKIEEIIRKDPSVDLLSLGYVFNYLDYKPKFTSNL